MKSLVLVRHAKAVQWGYEDDFSRELTDRGKSDAAKVSACLKSTKVIPDMIISSPALRAMQTALIFADTFSFPAEKIIKDKELYDGITTGELIESIQNFPDETECVFIFGHNPSFESYARELCRSFDREMPTSSAVVIDFYEDSWEEINVRSGEPVNQISPKTLSPEN